MRGGGLRPGAVVSRPARRIQERAIGMPYGEVKPTQESRPTNISLCICAPEPDDSPGSEN